MNPSYKHLPTPVRKTNVSWGCTVLEKADIAIFRFSTKYIAIWKLEEASADNSDSYIWNEFIIMERLRVRQRNKAGPAVFDKPIRSDCD